MNRKQLTVMWVSARSSRPLIFSIPKVLFYMCLALFLTSWLFLAMGGYFGNRLHHDTAQLREHNSRLQHKVKDLDSLRQIMEQIQKEEGTIRGFLGVDGGQGGGLALGQGGEPSINPVIFDSKDAIMSGSTSSPRNFQSNSITDEAKSLQTGLMELVAAMRDQKQLLDSTPSIVPVKGYDYWVSSGFGWRRSPFTGVREFHNGLDICGRRGTPIISPANGIVSKKGRHRYLGRYLRIKHGKGITTTYGHLLKSNVSPGQKVRRGEVIAFMGNSGRSSGTHLHYTVRLNRKCVNPLHYILNTKKNRLVDSRVR